MTPNHAPLDPWPSIGQFLASLRTVSEDGTGNGLPFVADDGELSTDGDGLSAGSEH